MMPANDASAPETIADLVHKAVSARAAWCDPAHETALRLFHGFAEGAPDLAIDLYGSTVVFHNYADPPVAGLAAVQVALRVVRNGFPWLRAGIVKTRHSPAATHRRGELLFGDGPDVRVREGAVWYAVDLTMNRDCSLYLDTRNLRRWAFEHLRGKSVLNAFAYTGSLGVAAAVGGAAEVVQLDRNARFLRVAQRSCELNGLPVVADHSLAGDFWAQIARFKRAGRRFDAVLLDPPFFAASTRGVVDLARNSARLINKVRPLINDGGWLVAVNNALFVSGRDYLATLEALCADGYLAIDGLIPVPEDFTGVPETRRGTPITDPAPFNHSTKIAVLKVRRKPA